MRRLLETGNKIVAGFIILATILVTFIPILDIDLHLQDYLVHFLIFLIVSGLIGLIINQKIILFTSFGCAAALALFLKNASNSELKNPKPNDKDKITVAHLNMSLLTEIETLESILKDTTIDIISLQEYTPDWANIVPLMVEKSFPYSYQDVRIDLYGKAIFSRIPMANQRLIETQGVPNLEVEVNLGKKILTILSIYLIPALDARSRSNAKQQFIDLSHYCLSEQKTRIVMGEFNQVYWSHDIISFRNSTGLQNCRRNVSPNSLKMPYNHIFYTPDIESYHFEELRDAEGGYIGSKSYFQIKTKKQKYK